MFLSVIIVTYNNRQEIGPCLQALAATTKSCKTQTILIDNLSVDGTREWLQDQQSGYDQQFDRFHLLVNEKNLGFTAAVNQGLRLADGDAILLLNPDVVLTDDSIPVLLDRLFRQARTGAVAPQLRFPDGRIQSSCRRFPRKRDIFFEMLPPRLIRALGLKSWKMPEFDHRQSRVVDQPQGAFLLFKRQVLVKVGMLDERFFMFFSDVDWCRRVKESGYDIWFIAEVFVYHTRGASVHRSRIPMLVTSHRSFRRYFAKYDHSPIQKTGTIIVFIVLLGSLFFRLAIAAAVGAFNPVAIKKGEPGSPAGN